MIKTADVPLQKLAFMVSLGLVTHEHLEGENLFDCRTNFCKKKKKKRKRKKPSKKII